MQAGLLSREIISIGVPTLSRQAEGNIVGGAMREPSADPARSENQGMCVSLHAREPGDPSAGINRHEEGDEKALHRKE